MNQIKTLWDRIEKYAIYGVLLTFFALELMSAFIPAIASFMDTCGALVLIATVLLFLFRYLDERLSARSLADIFLTPGFTQGCVDILKKKKHKRIEIFAHTSFMYLLAFQESNIIVDELKLLLHRVDQAEAAHSPSDEWRREQYEAEIDRLVKIWFELRQEGRIQTLTIKYYSFDPLYHFMMLDGAKLHFGLFKPKRDFPGTDLMSTYIVSSETSLGRTLIHDFKTEFDSVWEEFGFSQTTEDVV